MLINKIIISSALLCILLSLLNSGLLSALLNLCAFSLLAIYALQKRQRAIKQKTRRDLHNKLNISQSSTTNCYPKRDPKYKRLHTRFFYFFNRNTCTNKK